MENRINKTIKFSENEKYFILKQAIYKENSYYMTVKITPDGEDFTDQFAIFQESQENGKTYFERLTDPNVLKVLLKYLDAPDK